MSAEKSSPPLDVVIVEDDVPLSDVLAMHLSAQGWRVRTAHNGDHALAACAERVPDVVVLDVMLPKRSGIEVCEALRARDSRRPAVVMVTARGAELDVVLGLDSGADDYVVKPVRPKELVARVRAVMRRLGRDDGPGASRLLESGRVVLDRAQRRATVGERSLRLTPSEFEMLAVFCTSPERVFTRLELLSRVFDSTFEGYQRNVDCHVTRLRRKLESAGLRPAPIDTVHGTGYRWIVARAT